MAKRIATHIHKLRRKTYKNTGHSVFFCALPDCYFKSEPDFLIGKETICNRCGRAFIMNMYTITLAKPHCDECTIKRGNHYEKRVNFRRNNPDRRNPEANIPASAVVTNSIANDVVSDLEQRLKSAQSEALVTSDSGSSVNNEPIIKEYNPDEDDL